MSLAGRSSYPRLIT
ncbi:Protein of unknown function [Propionibacterium freudenreichii]|nr:Protein of unknown function [Propionibacterium freudenreichii]CEG96279.1 Protein of unknown function [Propionibacterium freudenreichii]